MDQSDKLNRWIQVLGKDLGLDLGPDENNIATLTFGRDLCISIAPPLSSWMTRATISTVISFNL